MGITDYGHRSVPNVILGAPLLSDGTWNSAHFKNTTYDSLVKQYNAASDVQSQQGVAKQIQELLLDETPVIFAYFYDYLGATAGNVGGRRDHAHRPRPAGGRRLHLLTTHPAAGGAGGGTSRRPRWHGSSSAASDSH